MEKQISAHQFPKVYEALDISLSELGCVMLDLEPSIDLIKIGNEMESGKSLYYSGNKEYFWIDGFVGKNPHVTLLYGLLGPAIDYKQLIDEVLTGWELKTIEVESIGYFESPYKDEPYRCIIAHVKVTPKLLEGHNRLEFLPHINTFAGYKAHFTLAYVKKDKVSIDSIKNFSSLVGKKFNIKDKLNLGGNK